MLTKDLTSALDHRKYQLPHCCYKIAGSGGMGTFGLDVLLPDVVDCDETHMSLWIPFADGNRRDGVGDLLEVGGINTERHRGNPIVLFDHGKNVTLPIGLAEDPNTKSYTVVIDPVSKTAKLNAFFYRGDSRSQDQLQKCAGGNCGNLYEHAVFCEQTFDLAVKRYLRAGSIGYQVIAAKNLQPDYERGTPAGLHLLSVLMLEGSLVVLPANMDTVRKMLALPKVCGKPLSPYLVKSLAPYAPTKKKAVMGYEGKKALSADQIRAWLRSKAPEIAQLARTSTWGPLHDMLIDLLSDVGYLGQMDATVKNIIADLRRIVDRHRERHGAAPPDDYFLQTQVYTVLDRIPQQIVGWRQKGFEVGDVLHAKETLYQQAISGTSVVEPFVRSGEGVEVVQVFANDAVRVRRDDGQESTQAPGRFREWGKKTMNEEEIKALRLKYSVKVKTEEDRFASQQRARRFQEEIEGQGGKVYNVVHDKHTNEWVVYWDPHSIDTGPTPKWDRKGFSMRDVEDLKKRGASDPVTYGVDASGDFWVKLPDGKTQWYSDGNTAYDDAAKFARMLGVQAQKKSITYQKSLDLRKKYRPVKALRRKLKSGSPGAAVLYVSDKDLETAKKAADEKGLEWHHLGSSGGLSKVKLIGADNGIDHIAQQYGKVR